MINKDGTFFQYNSGDLVYIISPLKRQLCIASRKVMIKYVGPVVERYLVQMWSQTKSSGIKLLEGHGVSKNLDPNIQPEKQAIRRPLKSNKILQEKPR